MQQSFAIAPPPGYIAYSVIFKTNNSWQLYHFDTTLSLSYFMIINLKSVSSLFILGLRRNCFQLRILDLSLLTQSTQQWFQMSTSENTLLGFYGGPISSSIPANTSYVLELSRSTPYYCKLAYVDVQEFLHQGGYLGLINEYIWTIDSYDPHSLQNWLQGRSIPRETSLLELNSRSI